MTPRRLHALAVIISLTVVTASVDVALSGSSEDLLTPRKLTRTRNDNLLINGSFEEGPDLGTRDFIWIGEGSTAIEGWTVTRGEIDYIGPYWQHAHGKRSIDLQGREGFVGGIKQTFATTIGRRYRVTFSLAGNPDNKPTEKRLEVSAAGKKAVFTFDITGKTRAKMGWVTQAWEFTAVAPTTTLEFFAPAAELNGWGPVLDCVSVIALDE